MQFKGEVQPEASAMMAPVPPELQIVSGWPKTLLPSLCRTATDSMVAQRAQLRQPKALYAGWCLCPVQRCKLRAVRQQMGAATWLGLDVSSGRHFLHQLQLSRKTPNEECLYTSFLGAWPRSVAYSNRRQAVGFGLASNSSFGDTMRSMPGLFRSTRYSIVIPPTIRRVMKRRACLISYS